MKRSESFRLAYEQINGLKGEDPTENRTLYWAQEVLEDLEIGILSVKEARSLVYFDSRLSEEAILIVERLLIDEEYRQIEARDRAAAKRREEARVASHTSLADVFKAALA